MSELLKFELDFLRESNRIEGIIRAPNAAEKRAYAEFVNLEKLTIPDVEKFVTACQPGAALRERAGMNVRVGNHIPPVGGPLIRADLDRLLDRATYFKQQREGRVHAFQTHIQYETLHPFTDGNGRSGRMIWWWMMGGDALGFLHRFYYQTLGATR